LIGGIVSAEWYRGESNQKLESENKYGVSGLRAGMYYVLLVDNNRCSYTERFIISNKNSSCINIPSAFTPNADGVHDEWVIENLQRFYPNAEIQIYNRIGERVYFNTSTDAKWDGTYNGVPLPVSTYHYIIDLKDGSSPKTGQITILR
jgi:gliding motility-associated-like protein